MPVMILLSIPLGLLGAVGSLFLRSMPLDVYGQIGLVMLIGLMPLVVASGAGAGSRQSLGTAVVGGLTFATIMIVFVPIFYVVIERAREGKNADDQTQAKATPPTGS